VLLYDVTWAARQKDCWCGIYCIIVPIWESHKGLVRAYFFKNVLVRSGIYKLWVCWYVDVHIYRCPRICIIKSSNRPADMGLEINFARATQRIDVRGGRVT
jgi:hypothetical protein